MGDNRPKKTIATNQVPNIFDELFKDIRADTLQKARPAVPESSPDTSFDQEIQKQRARTEEVKNNKLQAEVDTLEAENENLRNDQRLKSLTLILLFALLAAETVIIFTLAFFQGFRAWGFDLDLLTFRIVVVATLLQISAMLTFAVRHLFPRKI